MYCAIAEKKWKITFLESLGAGHDVESKLVIYSMVNTAFTNYLDSIDSFNWFSKNSNSAEQDYLQTDFTYFLEIIWIQFWITKSTPDTKRLFTSLA